MLKVNDDPEEDTEARESRIRESREEGNRQKEEGRREVITFDLVFRARGNMQPDKANGPEDTIVTEMLKELPAGTLRLRNVSNEGFVETATTRLRGKLLSGCSCGSHACMSLSSRGCRAIGLMSVMAKWYSSVVVLMLNNTKKGPKGWEAARERPKEV